MLSIHYVQSLIRRDYLWLSSFEEKSSYKLNNHVAVKLWTGEASQMNRLVRKWTATDNTYTFKFLLSSHESTSTAYGILKCSWNVATGLVRRPIHNSGSAGPIQWPIRCNPKLRVLKIVVEILTSAVEQASGWTISICFILRRNHDDHYKHELKAPNVCKSQHLLPYPEFMNKKLSTSFLYAKTSMRCGVRRWLASSLLI